MHCNAFTVFAILILSFGLLFCGTSFSHGQISQSEVSLELQQSTWDHSTLQVLIVTEENESWWDPVYADSTLRAVSIWNNAFRNFASNYSDFEYISRLNMVSTLSDVEKPGFDVYVFWTTEPLEEGDEAVGLAVTYSAGGIILNCTITLDVYNNLGTHLSEVDMQNVALHEFGHSLGINHSNYTGDAMYPASLLGSPARAVSTLNVYGIAAVFGWMENSNQPNPNENWPKTTTIMLPPNIEYTYCSIASENIPPYSNLEPVIGPLRTILGVILMFISLEFFIVIVIAVTILMAVLIFYRRKK
jgi:predicted Zn-dependent protease